MNNKGFYMYKDRLCFALSLLTVSIGEDKELIKKIEDITESVLNTEFIEFDKLTIEEQVEFYSNLTNKKKENEIFVGVFNFENNTELAGFLSLNKKEHLKITRKIEVDKEHYLLTVLETFISIGYNLYFCNVNSKEVIVCGVIEGVE